MSNDATIKRSSILTLPRLSISDGTIESLKWFALVLMTIDHINKFLLDYAVPEMFAVGRIAMPLFAFVLAFNLARPGTLEKGVYPRVITRLAMFGTIASIPYIALDGMEWLPLNIMVLLLIAASMMYLIDKGDGKSASVALALFIIGGLFVEYWWPGIILCLAAWHYCRQPSWTAIFFGLLSFFLLSFINGNWWALAAVPLIVISQYANFAIPRLKSVFYVYYPAHLSVIWAISYYS